MKIRVRQEPRISVSKLGEYAAVNDAARRRRIVCDQKRPKDYITPFYAEAQDFLTDFLLGGARSHEVLWEAVDMFSSAEASTPWQESRNQANADALVSFLGVVDELNLSDFSLRRGQQDPPKLLIQGVSVSVRPEVVFTSQNRLGNVTEGAVKLYINKSHLLSEEAGAYTATTLHQFVSAYPYADGFCDYRLCYVVDVFGQHVFTAPRSFKQRRKSIEAACEEIKRAWPEL